MIGQTKGAWLKHKAGQFKHYAVGGAALAENVAKPGVDHHEPYRLVSE